MFSPCLARVLAYLLSIGFLLGTARAAAPVADRGREILPPNDGWGSVPAPSLPQGTIGGSNAAPARTVTVTNRKELIAALAWPDATPKLIYVKGTIDLNTDEAGNPLSCKNYLRPDPATGEPFSLYAFMTMYDPESPLEKDRKDPVGGQENARHASHAAQEERVHVRVPPNTTLFGLGANATLLGAWLDIDGNVPRGNQAMNVIVRNLALLDTMDCFPEWSPTDGVTGNWNSAYDSISIRHATHVWIDHDRFADSRTLDELQPTYFGRRFQVHDGELDITGESDFVTVSWNVFAAHDKTMLIGNSDDAVQDRDRLRVTLHHNFFDGVGQRAPRVRFGKVHVYDNLYRTTADTNYHSSWGVGVESRIYAEKNYFDLNKLFGVAEIIKRDKGTRMTDLGNCRRVEDGTCPVVDVLGSWNAHYDPDLAGDAGWTPTLYGAAGAAESPEAAREKILSGSGPN